MSAPTRKTVAEKPVPEPAVERVVGEPVPLVAEEQDFTTQLFDEGWFAALREVEAQWNQGHDTLARFLATQKRDRA